MQISTSRPFTKSLFKIALSCPTKLRYARQKDQYANSMLEDDFLAALAEGGFQVGEIAKIYLGVEDKHDLGDIRSYQDAMDKTEQLLAEDNIVIAEAAFGVDNMFVRADIVRKHGKTIDLIEVKAKSFDPEEDSFLGRRPEGAVASSWKEYLYDLAFQKYVLTKAMPEYQVRAFLMMADKSKEADIDNLNQLFKIVRVDGRSRVEVAPQARQIIADSQTQVITPFDVDDIINSIINGTVVNQEKDLGCSFVDFVNQMCHHWTNGTAEEPILGTKCFKCEYCNDGTNNLKDGRDECWLAKAGIAPSRPDKPLLMELWGRGLQKRNQWTQEGIYYLDQITEDIMPLKDEDKPYLSTSQRRWLQVAIATQNESLMRYYGDDLQGDVYLDRKALKDAMSTWIYPLHMIDFETTTVALPYYKGMKPYEPVVFQFSHHIIEEDGTIRHAGQYLNENVNEFPNFHFVRALRDELIHDNGTIFRYSAHENTMLRAIAEQLAESNEPDKEELIAFIDSITKGGPREMVDLQQTVLHYYYCYNQMHGSNSIKQVLPAVLNSSQYLKDKYSQTIYGTDIPSLNIPADDPIAWIQMLPDGTVDNPYHLLPSVAEYVGENENVFAKLEQNDDDDMTIANGGAALTAYSKLMFSDGTMSDALRKALLRYCELDTMAMVFIWEYFHHEAQKA